MNAKDIMTSPVITVAPHTLVTELAALLCERRISAVPVMDAERLAGIVSEADLLHRYELGTDCALCGEPWWLEVFSADRSSDDYVKSHARYVRDIMTRDVATVSPASAYQWWIKAAWRASSAGPTWCGRLRQQGAAARPRTRSPTRRSKRA
jgi:predicted transcriptional regulator